MTVIVLHILQVFSWSNQSLDWNIFALCQCNQINSRQCIKFPSQILELGFENDCISSKDDMAADDS
jgi:hypothetical protein